MNTNKERGDMGILLGIAVFVIAVIGFGIYAFSWYGATATKVCTVEDKQATAKKDAGTSYILFTKECGQLQVADDMILGNYNSTDVYGSVRVGESYTFKTVGFRNGFLSTYPNVDEVTP